jgi:hypothetical protein
MIQNVPVHAILLDIAENSESKSSIIFEKWNHEILYLQSHFDYKYIKSTLFSQNSFENNLEKVL